MTPERPTLLLLPGLDGSAQLFDWFIAQLPADQCHKAVAYSADAPANLDALAQIVEACAIGCRSFVVIAESFSGPVALRVMVRAQLNIVGAVFVASFARCPNPLLHLGRVLPIATIAPFIHRDSALKAACVGWDASANVVRRLKQILEAVPLAVLKARLDLLRDVDESNALARSAIPLLYLRAMHDRLVASGCSRDFLDARHCQTREVPGPHFLLQSRPAKCWEIISAWLNTIA